MNMKWIFIMFMIFFDERRYYFKKFVIDQLCINTNITPVQIIQKYINTNIIDIYTPDKYYLTQTISHIKRENLGPIPKKISEISLEKMKEVAPELEIKEFEYFYERVFL